MAGTQLVTVRVGAVTLPGIADLIGSTGSLYATGNTIGQTSSTSGAPGGLTFSGAGVVSVGFSSGSVIIAATGGSSATSAGWSAVGNTTGASSTTRPLTAQTISGAGGITVGYSAGSIVISGPTAGAASATSMGQSAVGNTTGLTSSQSAPITAATISGAGVVSVGYSNGTVLISAPAAAASATSMGQSAIGNTTGLTSSQTAALTAAIISGAGIVSVGYSAGTLLVSAPAVIASATSLQSSALGNTTGQSSSTTLSLTAGAISGAGIVSVGFSGGSLLVSASSAASATSAGSSAIGNTTAQSSSTTLPLTAGVVSGAGIVSVGFSAGSLVISASAAAQSVQTIGGFATGNTTNASSTTFDARSVTVSGAGAISVGYSANNILLISAPAAVTTSAPQTLSYFDPLLLGSGVGLALNSLTVGSLMVMPMNPPVTVTFNQFRLLVSHSSVAATISVGTSAGASKTLSASFGFAQTNWIALYSRVDGTTFTLNGSTSVGLGATTSWTASQTGSSVSIGISFTFAFPVGTTTSSESYTQPQVVSSSNSVAIGAVVSFAGQHYMPTPWASSMDSGLHLVGHMRSTATASGANNTACTIGAGNWAYSVFGIRANNGGNAFRYNIGSDLFAVALGQQGAGLTSSVGSAVPVSVNFTALSAIAGGQFDQMYAMMGML